MKLQENTRKLLEENQETEEIIRRVLTANKDFHIFHVQWLTIEKMTETVNNKALQVDAPNPPFAVKIGEETSGDLKLKILQHFIAITHPEQNGFAGRILGTSVIEDGEFGTIGQRMITFCHDPWLLFQHEHTEGGLVPLGHAWMTDDNPETSSRTGYVSPHGTGKPFFV